MCESRQVGKEGKDREGGRKWRKCRTGRKGVKRRMVWMVGGEMVREGREGRTRQEDVSEGNSG